VLFAAVQAAWNTFVQRAEASGRTVPRFCVREVEGYLRCGVLGHGFARVFCARCKRGWARSPPRQQELEFAEWGGRTEGGEVGLPKVRAGTGLGRGRQAGRKGVGRRGALGA